MKQFEWMMCHGCQTETFYYDLKQAEEIMHTAIEAGRPIPDKDLRELAVGEIIKGDSMWASFKRVE